MRILKIKKEHEGKIIYGLSWLGNNTGNRTVEFEVMKVNRKYVKMNRYGRPDNYHPETGVTQVAINSGYGSNSGYKFFDSLADIGRYNDNRNKIRDIRSYLDYSPDLTHAEIDIIHKIIKGR